MARIKDHSLEFRSIATKKLFDMDAYDADVERGVDPKEAKEKQIRKMHKGAKKKPK